MMPQKRKIEIYLNSKKKRAKKCMEIGKGILKKIRIIFFVKGKKLEL